LQPLWHEIDEDYDLRLEYIDENDTGSLGDTKSEEKDQFLSVLQLLQKTANLSSREK
jgi:hypothetical protein